MATVAILQLLFLYYNHLLNLKVNEQEHHKTKTSLLLQPMDASFLCCVQQFKMMELNADNDMFK
jgi:hypothetical protein